jgi:hypothetical protein
MPQACPGDRYARRYQGTDPSSPRCHRLARWSFTLPARDQRTPSQERNDPPGKPVAFGSGCGRSLCSGKRNDPAGKPVAFSDLARLVKHPRAVRGFTIKHIHPLVQRATSKWPEGLAGHTRLPRHHASEISQPSDSRAPNRTNDWDHGAGS